MRQILLGVVLSAAVAGWFLAFTFQAPIVTGSMTGESGPADLAGQISASEVQFIDLKGDRWFVVQYRSGERFLGRASDGADDIVAALTRDGVDLSGIEVRDSTKPKSR